MDKEERKTPLIIELLKNFAAVFTASLVAMSLAGMILSRNIPNADAISTLFAMKNGLSYNSILQITGFSLVITLIAVFLFSGQFEIKIKFSLRLLILFLLSLVVVSVFSIVFGWFPINQASAWIGFILCFIVCYAISAGLTVLNLKIQKNKYGKLLENYKNGMKDK
ncbi:MAG: hypothetical protein FWD78_13450 [Treponema sp.]|nr:hypothetical protein [Treponema sp.]